MPTKLKKVYTDTCVWGELISKPASQKRTVVEKIMELASRRSVNIFISKYVRDEIEEAPRAIKKVLL